MKPLRVLKRSLQNPFRKLGLSGGDYNRLLSLPRYSETMVRIFNKNLKISDPKTFLEGLKEIFLNESYLFRSKKNSPFIIDCGANIGLSVIYYKQIFPDATIFAFEADPDIFQILDYNLSLFGFKDISIYNKAVWDRNEKINFQKEGGYSGRISERSSLTTVEVESIRLYEFLDQQVEMLKMDIEGAEYRVLMDIEPQLAGIDKLFIEYHSHIDEKQNLDEILSVLSKNGFRYYLKEAYSPQKPLFQVNDLQGMDLQVNIFALRP